MTRDEVLKMEAGRELDALIHKFLFPDNIQPEDIQLPSWQDAYGYDGTSYSTDIADAWEVTVALRYNGWGMVLMNKYSHSPQRPLEYGVDLRKDGKVFIGYASTAPLAICRAALLAVMELR